jgi:hypothetical protein
MKEEMLRTIRNIILVIAKFVPELTDSGSREAVIYACAKRITTASVMISIM